MQLLFFHADYCPYPGKQMQQLAANLTAKNVAANSEEKFNTLVPKVMKISGGESPTTTVLYDLASPDRDKVSLLYDGTIYSVADFTALHADFCSAKNNYALNYGTTVFGWDYSCYTCCTLPISVTASTANCNPFPCWQYRGWNFTLGTV